ncbi:MAG: hypothetical protein AB7G37_18685 [Solirubrobacteraceae bacterium]
MADVRVRIDADDEARRAMLEVLARGDDVHAVTPLDDGARVHLAGYAREAAESRAHELLRTAAAEARVDPNHVRVVGDGWEFGEDHVR